MKMRMERLHTGPYLALIQSALTQGCAVGDDPKAQMEALTAPLLQLLPHNPLMSVDEIKVSLGGKNAQFSYSVGTQGVTPEDLKAPALAPVLMNKAVFKMGAQTSPTSSSNWPRPAARSCRPRLWRSRSRWPWPRALCSARANSWRRNGVEGRRADAQWQGDAGAGPGAATTAARA